MGKIAFTIVGILLFVWSTHVTDPNGSFSNRGQDGWKTGGAKRAILAYTKR